MIVYDKSEKTNTKQQGRIVYQIHKGDKSLLLPKVVSNKIILNKRKYPMVAHTKIKNIKKTHTTPNFVKKIFNTELFKKKKIVGGMPLKNQPEKKKSESNTRNCIFVNVFKKFNKIAIFDSTKIIKPKNTVLNNVYIKTKPNAQLILFTLNNKKALP